MDIDHISISRFGVKETCDRQYKYKYHLKMVPKAEPIYFLYGKIVHKIIEVFTRARGQQALQECADAVVNGKILLEEAKPDKPSKYEIGVPHKLPLDYRRKLPEHLRQFAKLTQMIGTDGDVEWNFKFDLDPPVGRCLVGVIDRIIFKNGKIFIIDYKTTKKGPWRKDRTTIGSDLQLQSYARVAQREYNIPAENIQCALYFLDGGELVSTRFSEETLATVEPRLLKAFKEIEFADPELVRGNTGDHCWRCDYNNICPEWNVSL